MPESLVMCTPEGFAVNYEINPWMKHQIGNVSHALATRQWQALHEMLASHAEIRLIHGDPTWPDLVFTANAGLPLPWARGAGRRIILANFRYPQRQGEKAINRAWFESLGWNCIELPDDVCFEGAGDALFDSQGRLWVGLGPRSDAAAPRHLAHHYEGPIHSIHLVNPAFYHLDTCFCPLPEGHALYLPDAFDTPSNDLLQRVFGDRLIALNADEGNQFCANAVCTGKTIVMNQATPRLRDLLVERGFRLLETPLSEFMKSGGSAKCLTLSLDGWLFDAIREVAKH